MSTKETGKLTWVKRIGALVAAVVLLAVTVPLLRDYLSAPPAGSDIIPAARNNAGLLAWTDRIELNGETYVRRSGIETYLLLGIDKESTNDSESTLAGQADVLLLLVMDRKNDSYRILQINRDTMTQIAVLSDSGEIKNEMFAPVCLAYSLGSGEADSCQNTIRALQYILGDIQIDGYAAMGMESLPRLNEVVGGVTVTVEQDLTMLDPAFKEGATIRLDSSNVESYLRVRMAAGESNNIRRMSRHRQYMNAWVAAAREKIAEDNGAIMDFVGEMREFMVTDMTEKRMSSIANDAYKYTDGGFLTIAGENSRSESYNRFYADESSVREVLAELFYEKENG